MRGRDKVQGQGRLLAEAASVADARQLSAHPRRGRSLDGPGAKPPAFTATGAAIWRSATEVRGLLTVREDLRVASTHDVDMASA